MDLISFFSLRNWVLCAWHRTRNLLAMDVCRLVTGFNLWLGIFVFGNPCFQRFQMNISYLHGTEWDRSVVLIVTFSFLLKYKVCLISADMHCPQRTKSRIIDCIPPLLQLLRPASIPSSGKVPLGVLQLIHIFNFLVLIWLKCNWPNVR